MDYNIEKYLDDETLIKIKSISNKLDNIMDYLYFGNNCSISDFEKVKSDLVLAKEEYDDLIKYVTKILKNDRTLLSSEAGKKFILSFLTSMLLYRYPLLFFVPIINFAKGMKYYTAARCLSNNEVIDEYLSYFNDIKRRIENYDDVLSTKVDKKLKLEKN